MNCSDEKNIVDEVKETSMNIRKYQLPEEYPSVCVDKKDRKWLPLIFDDYSSMISEYTAIAQYVYAHFKAESKEDDDRLIKEISDAFLYTSIVEMFHLEFLSDLILQLGGNPKFVDGSKKIWRSNFVSYGRSLKENLELAIKAENDAINQYEKHIKIIKNNSIDKLLERIVDDELLHLQIFTELLNRLQKSRKK